MSTTTLMDRLRSFLGFNQQPPVSQFRNPLWGSDDDDDEDDILNSRNTQDPFSLHEEMTRHVNDMMKSFGDMFNNFEDHVDAFQNTDIPETEIPESNLREYYLKPGYYNKGVDALDTDLDGKVSSHEISDLLKREDKNESAIIPYDGGDFGVGRTFFKSIITTSVTRSDGTVETRTIVRDNNGVVEDTTTQQGPTPKNTNSEIIPAGDFYRVMPNITSFWRMFN